MIRRLFTVASVLSLALCLSAGILWLGSYLGEAWLGYTAPDRYAAGIVLHRGAILLSYGIPPDNEPFLGRGGIDCGAARVPLSWSGRPSDCFNPGFIMHHGPLDLAATWKLTDRHYRGSAIDTDDRTEWERAGFAYTLGLVGYPDGWATIHAWRILIPSGATFLCIPLLALTPTIRFLVRLRTAKRISRRQCVSCGYDLRASKDRCPECGTPIPVKMTP
jgi:hypothetical protein